MVQKNAQLIAYVQIEWIHMATQIRGYICICAPGCRWSLSFPTPFTRFPATPPFSTALCDALTLSLVLSASV